MIESTSVDWAQTTGAKLYRRAKQLIPNGTQLLSKRPESFLPELWPSYYSKAKGCEVWDLDGRRFIDMCINAVGACLLGFADHDVDQAVKQCIDRGNLSTLNVPQEVELAELLCEIHPWADMVRYTRTGGETMAVAVRIARAASGRDKIAFCGYFGWCDWYLAANLGSADALDGHLLPGLEPTGVPRGLQGTMLPFRYNHIEELEALVPEHGSEIGVIAIEPVRYNLPKDDFLGKVRRIADRIGAVLVFDEITCGWRNHFGGIHLKLGVNPDIAAFAKSISNGYPMGAVIGRREVMEAAQRSFISSTYWTDAIGPTAALATIRKMRDVKLWQHTNNMGKRVQAGWRDLAAKHGLDITIEGLPPLCHLTFTDVADSQALVTLMVQCMLEHGYLTNTSYYATLAHTESIVDQYLSALDEVFAVLRRAVDQDNVSSLLKGPVGRKVFGRLT